MGALKQRLADSNKNLQAQALGLVARLARATGRAIDRCARPLLGPALRNLSDNKATVGAVCVFCLCTCHCSVPHVMRRGAHARCWAPRVQHHWLPLIANHTT